MTEKEVLTSEEAAAYLRISMPTMLKMLQDGIVPAVRVGRRWRISRQVLEDWLKKGGEITE